MRVRVAKYCRGGCGGVQVIRVGQVTNANTVDPCRHVLLSDGSQHQCVNQAVFEFCKDLRRSGEEFDRAELLKLIQKGFPKEEDL